MLTRLTVLIVSHCIKEMNHYAIHLKLIKWYVNSISII